ncbi:MAG: hypothetical protein HY735_15820 [Verrucomicrobia bacterium]|nr:hypothetical protein [Verrucomicrobiota bacterium]
MPASKCVLNQRENFVANFVQQPGFLRQIDKVSDKVFDKGEDGACWDTLCLAGLQILPGTIFLVAT